MVQPGFGSLDTPRTNVGDATYLSRRPDFDMTQEPSFVSPPKDSNNLLAQLRNGRSGGVNLRTPRGRGPFNDRPNPPASIGGAEFTPMLKSATRNSARRRGRDSGVPATPSLDALGADLTPVPGGEASMFSRSYSDPTLPVINSSAASTPMAIPERRNAGKGPLQDGHQLSLREQENVIDKIEKENFGLKLKIHFLEEALRKAGPGFSEAALKENTELKVDKVTMQRELHRYKKHLTASEKDLEDFRQQMLEMQERAKRKYADESQRAEMDRLRALLSQRDAEIESLQREVDDAQKDDARVDQLRDEVGDLEADVREKDRIISEHEDQLEDLRDRFKGDSKDKEDLVEEKEEELRELKTKLLESQTSFKTAQRRVIELEEKAQHNEELDEARDTIDDLERNARALEAQVDEMKEKLADAVSDKDRATEDLEELQEEMANKSVVTKGLSRQIEEKVERLQSELDQAGHDYANLEKQFSATFQENEDLQTKMREAKRERDSTEREIQSLKSRYEELRADLEQQHAEAFKDNEDLRTKMRDTRRERESSDRELQSLRGKYADLKADFDARKDQDNILESRNETLRSEATVLQRETTQLKKSIGELEASLAQERQHTLDIERDVREQYRSEINTLNDEISDLQAEIRERDNLYDNDSDKWESEKRTLESERSRAEEKAAGLQRTIDKLRESEGSLSDKETRLQEAVQSETERHKRDEAILTRQIQELQRTLEERQAVLTELRDELSGVRDELRQSHLDFQAQTERVGGLEDEVEVLQAALDDGGESQAELGRAKRECDDLRQEVETLRTAADLAKSCTDASRLASSGSQEKIRAQLSAANREKQTLQDRLASTNIEMHELRSSLADVRAERDELEGAARTVHGAGDAYRLDQERVDLRAAKTRLDGEVRRLREENRALGEERVSAETALEEEIEKAAEEEERLSGEILALQARLRQSSSSETQDLVAARRTIRDLERRIEGYEVQLAAAGNMPGGEGNSELSVIRRDLTLARQKELEYLQKESSHKETVRALTRQLTDFERRAHDAELSRMAASPSPSIGSARRAEASELRHQLSAAKQSLSETKAKLREAERNLGLETRELQERLEELEDERVTLEQGLEDARNEAGDAKAEHERLVQKLRSKLEKAEQALSAQARQRVTGGDKDLREVLRRTQKETEALEHDVRRQQEVIEGLTAAEGSLRRKLERARGERAAFRLGAEKLGRDVKELRANATAATPVVRFEGQKGGVESEKKHEREVRGLVMQMEWMQGRWEREAGLRADAAYAKRFLQLQLEVAEACNKAQLRDLESIRSDLLRSRKPLPPTLQQRKEPPSAPTKLRRALVAVRFIARMRVAARAWQVQEGRRRKIVECVEGMKARKGRARRG